MGAGKNVPMCSFQEISGGGKTSEICGALMIGIAFTAKLCLNSATFNPEDPLSVKREPISG